MDNLSTEQVGISEEASTPSVSTIGMSRRDVLKTAAVGVIASIPLLQNAARADDNWVSAGKSADFVTDLPKLVTLPSGDALYITRSAKGLTAISAKCTHRGCELGWTAADKQLECPCHGGAFLTDGTNVHGTRRSPDTHLPALQVVPVREKGGAVAVNLAGISDDLLTPRMG